MLGCLRIIFAGTSDFAAQHLLTLLNIKDKYQIVGVLTKPNKLKKSRQKISSNPVKILAEEENIPILQPISLNIEESQYWIQYQNADLMVVVAYGQILPKIILNMLPMG